MGTIYGMLCGLYVRRFLKRFIGPHLPVSAGSVQLGEPHQIVSTRMAEYRLSAREKIIVLEDADVFVSCGAGALSVASDEECAPDSAGMTKSTAATLGAQREYQASCRITAAGCVSAPRWRGCRSFTLHRN